MSTIHQFKCNGCNRRVPAHYNGEHYLPPTDWVELWDDNKAEMTDQHLCPECRPKFKPTKEEND